MGTVYIRPSSCSEDTKITLDNTLMVATRTMKNVIVPRTNMGVAADHGHIAFVYGSKYDVGIAPNIDIFDRLGRGWGITVDAGKVAYPMVILYDNMLEIFGGLLETGSPTNQVNRMSLRELVASQTKYNKAMHTLDQSRYGGSIAVCNNKIHVLGGITYNNTPSSKVDRYESTQEGTNVYTGYSTVARLDVARSFPACASINNRAFLITGGGDFVNNVAYNSVEVYAYETDGSLYRGTCEPLAVSQVKPLAVNLYHKGYAHILVGLGKTIQGTIVPNIDVYMSTGVHSAASKQIQSSRYATFTLPLEGNPSSAIGLSFADCVLFIVGYNDGVTKNKGYLVRMNYSAYYITPIEFNFSRNDMYGGVVGNETGYIAGGTKNGQPTGDVEIIRILRDAPIYPGMKYKLGSMTSEETASSLTLHPLNDEYKLSGYMKL